MNSCKTRSFPRPGWSTRWIALATLCLHGAIFSSAHAAVVVQGDVTPNPPGNSTNSVLYVGNTADGSLAIDNGSSVTSFLTDIGNAATASGVVSVSGSKSTLTSSAVEIGINGSGTLTVLSGGQVKGQGQVGALPSGSGAVTIDGVGSSWDNNGSLYLGERGEGSIIVQNGGLLLSGATTSGPTVLLQSSFIGYSSTGIGTLTVAGAQSAWNNSTDLTIGASGNGTLKILQGATVTIGGDTTVRRDSTATGQIDFDNGTLKTGGLLTSVGDLQGSGTIFTHGLVTDINLAFDNSHPLQQQFVFTDGVNQNVTVNIDASAAGSMGAGFQGQGSLSIAEGVVVNSRNGYLGYRAGSNGAATVSGAGSAWSMTGDLNVGLSGQGSLAIQNGGAVQVGGITKVNFAPSSSINFSNGTLTTKTLFADADQLTGVGTINTHGLVSDGALVFDPTHPAQQQIVLTGQPNQNVTINLRADGSGFIGAGYHAQGSLLIADGVVVSSAGGYLGYGPGSTGTATVSGAGSKWLMVGALSIGPSGVGNLTISKGGTVDDANASVANGKVVITDPGSIWSSPQGLNVGGINAPEVLVSNGGKLVSATTPASPLFGSTIGGLLLNSVGKVTVNGPGSNWTHAGSLTVGGGSQLVVSNAGTLASAGATVGNSQGGSNQPSSAIVTGPGSQWTNTSVLTIGSGFVASLDITHGGVVTSTAGAIGAQPLAIGSSVVNVSDPGSSWTMTDVLAVGGSVFSIGLPPGVVFPGGAATLNIGPGGAVRAGDTTIFAQGKINLQGGDLYTTSITFTLNPNPANSFSWTSGSLHVGTFNGDLVNSAGVLSPGQSPGKTTITGAYTQQTGASMLMEIAGTTSGTQYDFLNITGTANSTLGGTLQLSLLNGYLPSPTDTFTIVSSAGNLLGAFSNAPNGGRLTTSDGLGSFLVSYGVGSSFNAKQVVLSNFIAVPEPGSMALVGLLLGAVAAVRRRRTP